MTGEPGERGHRGGRNRKAGTPISEANGSAECNVSRYSHSTTLDQRARIRSGSGLVTHILGQDHCYGIRLILCVGCVLIALLYGGSCLRPRLGDSQVKTAEFPYQLGAPRSCRDIPDGSLRIAEDLTSDRMCCNMEWQTQEVPAMADMAIVPVPTQPWYRCLPADVLRFIMPCRQELPVRQALRPRWETGSGQEPHSRLHYLVSGLYTRWTYSSGPS